MSLISSSGKVINNAGYKPAQTAVIASNKAGRSKKRAGSRSSSRSTSRGGGR